jgi:hypothetical protein
MKVHTVLGHKLHKRDEGVFQLGLFNNDDNTSEYIAPDGGMINEG